MKFVETYKDKDGSDVVREFTVELRKGSSKVCHILVPEEEPFAIKIIESGWRETYHVIREWGDIGESDHAMMDRKELLEKYPEFLDVEKDVCPDVVVTSHEFLDNPNDWDLGRAIRKKSNEIYKRNNIKPGTQLEIPFKS